RSGGRPRGGCGVDRSSRALRKMRCAAYIRRPRRLAGRPPRKGDKESFREASYTAASSKLLEATPMLSVDVASKNPTLDLFMPRRSIKLVLGEFVEGIQMPQSYQRHFWSALLSLSISAGSAFGMHRMCWQDVLAALDPERPPI